MVQPLPLCKYIPTSLITEAEQAFLIGLAQMSDLDFGLIQQNISNKKASFQYQGCPLSLKSGKL